MGLVLVYVVWTLPFMLWMLQGYVRGIPRELEEAAAVDGAGRVQVLTSIVAPLLAPGIVVTTAVRVHLGLERVLLRARAAPVPRQGDAAAPAGAVRRRSRHRPARPAGRGHAARDHPEPRLLRDHPTPADARPARRCGQGMTALAVVPTTKKGKSNEEASRPRRRDAADGCARCRGGAGRQDQANVTNLTFATYVWQPTTVAAVKTIVDCGTRPIRRSRSRSSRST